jgi:ribosomal protein S18 acetylase RimI-like enzyme
MENLSYRYLSPGHFPQLFATFKEAFADYALDMSYLREENLRNRWTKNGVDFASSVGAFAGERSERMVGFMVIGLGRWQGEAAAFDAGTGVVKGFRGFGVAPGMFDLALAGLRGKGTKRFLLEVLQENRPAVKTYRKAGFRVTREFDCFLLDWAKARLAAPADEPGTAIEPMPLAELGRCQSFADWTPSWENGFAAVSRIPDEVFLYGLRQGGRWSGFLVYYPCLNWIMQLAVAPGERRRGVAIRLLARLARDLRGREPKVKMINVEHDDAATQAWAARVGFEPYARQYEMCLDL